MTIYLDDIDEDDKDEKKESKERNFKSVLIPETKSD